MTAKQEQAEKDYMAGMKYKDIATKYNVSINTVKAWKKRHGWQRESAGKVVPHNSKRVHPKIGERVHPKLAESNFQDGELTPQQELFAQLVGGQRLPLYRAYQIAYSKTRPKVATAMSQGSRLSNQANIKSRILKISETSAAENEWSLSKVVESLSFIHDEAKASVIADGLKKANSDALLNSLDRLTQLLKLSEQSKSEIRKVNAEADVAEQKARDVRSGGQDVGQQFDKMFERLKEDSDK